MKKPTIDSKIEDVAEAVADDALNSDSPSFRLEALKVLTGFRVGSYKSKKAPEDEPTGKTIGDFKSKIANADAPTGANVTPIRKDT